VSARSDVRAATAAVAHNGRLLAAQAAYALFAVVEQAVWVAVLLWAYGAGGTGLTGLVAVVQLVPAAVLAPVGGVLGDRVRRDRALVLVYVLQCVAITAVAVLVHVSAADWSVVVAAAAATIVIGWARPPHYALTAELSATPGEAAAANSLSGTLEGLGAFVGPALAGVGTLVVSVDGVVALCAALMLVAALLVATVLRPRRGRHRAAAPAQRHADQAPAGADDAGGLRVLATALRRTPAVSVVLLLVGVEFLVVGAMEVLGVAFTAQQLDAGPASAGLLIGSIGAGGLVGAAAAVVLSSRPRLGPAVVGSLLVGGAPLLAMPMITALVPALAVGVLSGTGLGFAAVADITLLQRVVADQLIARVLAVRESLLLGGLAVGAAVVPRMVDAVGPGGSYAILGGLLTVLALLAVAPLRRLDRSAVFRPQVIALLRGVDFLAVLDVRTIERLALRAVPLAVDAGTVVVREGEPGERYYVVEDGQLEVSVAGRAHRVELGAGDGFGEIALLRGVPRTASVRAIGSARLWALDRRAFLESVAGSAGAELADRRATERLDRLH
jgi:MFS family permease